MLKYGWIIVAFAFFIVSCRPEEEIVVSGTNSLRFSADTILFDTVFSTVGTVTLRVKVYNDHTNAIKIGKITIGGGSSSPFKVIVNGLETSSAKDVLILGKDSLYVLVKVVIDPQNQNLPYLVTDSILFTTGSSTQLIRLVAWGQDATFLNNTSIFTNTIWDSQKPYVIYGKLTIDSTAVLTIKEGVRLFFGANAALVVKGKLVTIGTSDKPVIFTTADLNKQNGVFPGQWAGIQINVNSVGNTVAWTTISQAMTGFTIAKNEPATAPDLTISRSIIKNMTNYAISGHSAHINLDNSLFSNCAKNVIRMVSGGKGLWVNNTFVTYSYDFFREGPVWYLSDQLTNSATHDLSLTTINNVVWGSFANEIAIDNNLGAGAFSIQAENNVLKTIPNSFWGNSNLVFDFVANKKLRTDTIHFVDTYLYNFRPDSISVLNQNAKNYPGFTDTNDLDGKTRDIQPDIGAYEYRKN